MGKMPVMLSGKNKKLRIMKKKNHESHHLEIIPTTTLLLISVNTQAHTCGCVFRCGDMCVQAQALLCEHTSMYTSVLVLKNIK